MYILLNSIDVLELCSSVLPFCGCGVSRFVSLDLCSKLHLLKYYFLNSRCIFLRIRKLGIWNVWCGLKIEVKYQNISIILLLKSVHFKKTAAPILILSKLWYFLSWFVLKVPQFWKNRNSRNSLLRMNGL